MVENNNPMLDQDALIRLINTTITPALTDLKYNLDGMRKDFNHYIELAQARSTTNTEKLADIETRVDRIEIILFGTGKPPDIGIVAEVSQINKWIEQRVWLERLIVAALVGQLIASIFVLITH